MVVDYERAWTRLQAEIAGKTQHGREPLLTRMAEIAGDCQVPEGEPERWLRLYGVDVSRVARPPQPPDTGPSSNGDSVAAGMGAGPGHPSPQGGHDGHSNGSRREPVGV